MAERDYRRTAEQAGRLSYCVDAGDGPCEGRMEADHQVRLADNGPRGYVVGRCARHHKVKTAAEAAADAAARRGQRVAGSTAVRGKGKGKGEEEARPRPPRRWRWVKHAVWLGAVLVGWTGWVVDYPAGVLVTVLWLAGCVALARHTALWGRRRREHERLVPLLARLLDTREQDLWLEVYDWQGWRPSRFLARFSVHFDVRDPKRRDYVLEEMRSRTGMRLQARWLPASDSVVFTAPAPGAAVEPVEPEPPEVGDAEKVQAGLAPLARGGEAITVVDAGPVDGEGSTALLVTYPPAVNDGSDEWRADLVRRAAARTGKRWRPTWRTADNEVLLERRPHMPAVIEHQPPADGNRWVLPFATDEHGDTVAWDTVRSPHIMGVGTTGSGKTSWIATLLTEAAWRGWDVALIDGKGTTLRGFAHWPGVVKVALGDPEAMHAALLWCEAELRHRLRRIERGEVRKVNGHFQFKPMLVIFDEVADAVGLIEQWWKDEPDPDRPNRTRTGRPSSLRAWGSGPRLGREPEMHWAIGLQQASADFFKGTEIRSNFACYVGCGALDQEGARMAFGSAAIGRDVPTDAPGRATVMYRGQQPAEVQVWWTPEPEVDGSMETEPQRRITARLQPRPQVALVKAEPDTPPLPLPAPEPEARREPLQAIDLAADDQVEVTLPDGEVITGRVDGQPLEVGDQVLVSIAGRPEGVLLAAEYPVLLLTPVG